METSLRYRSDSKALRIHAKEKIPIPIDPNTFLQVHGELDTRVGAPSYCSAVLRHFLPDLSASLGIGLQYDKHEKLRFSIRGKKSFPVTTDGRLNFNIKGHTNTDKELRERRSTGAAEFSWSILNFQRDQDVRLKVGYEVLKQVPYLQIRENNWTFNADGNELVVGVIGWAVASEVVVTKCKLRFTSMVDVWAMVPLGNETSAHDGKLDPSRPQSRTLAYNLNATHTPQTHQHQKVSFFPLNHMTRPFRLLGGVNSSSTADSESSPGSATVDSDFVVILAALLCALICVLGLVAVARCAWLRRLSTVASSSTNTSSRPSLPPPNKGVKKKILRSLPKMTFTAESASKFTDCAICLAEFAVGDEIRELPQCGHGFHVACIDTWLGSHSSCPSCRQVLVVTRCQRCGGFPASSNSENEARLKQREDDINRFLP
ncbi:hypothetical protein FNV43_RR12102 [Rhamnella rubrinervis]|uniref:RING-type domain-containing protein n=1 Tax=Rhamnella rubrinervis TaxID=2594499 RepID=A0A8K0H6X5_9ROSA|nr:hypothetical protein FNV43_RR12102 [Rhamnella rubrinervis]